jgi:hypothetical protein
MYSSVKSCLKHCNKFCKSILRVKQYASKNAVYGKLGKYPLHINRYVIKSSHALTHLKEFVLNQYSDPNTQMHY